MSWSGFKKAVNRAGAHVIMKTTKNTETSIDLEFDEKEQNFQIFENLISELNLELSNFKSIFTDLIETQFKLIKALDSFYGDYNFDLKSDNMLGINIDMIDNNDNNNNNNQNDSRINQRDGISLYLLKNLNDIRLTSLNQLSEPLDITVFQPIKELKEYNEEIHRLIKKRGRKKFDFDVSKNKLEKLQNDYNILELSLREENSSSSSNAVINSNNQLEKMKEKLDKFKNDDKLISNIYNDINQRLKNEIDEYIALRFSLLDPSFESFMKIQLKLYSDMNDKFKDNIKVDGSTREDHETGKLDNRLDEILNKMKALDIHNL
ncbi:Bridging integrator 3 [Pichia californica]|uniref:Bridging integrator 3 n=1 Tax=Pichia californica TaxID=460514 RepID=A0A9P6WIG5_9ASCO|nr:Bridging integrator 3 [[Candida] californica]KAG0687536.1 Bridging integrator 3 [[Candida] californica]